MLLLSTRDISMAFILFIFRAFSVNARVLKCPSNVPFLAVD